MRPAPSPKEAEVATESEVLWLASEEHPDAGAVASATRLDYDEIAERAALHSPIFLGVHGDALVGVSLVFDTHMGYLLAVDLMGPEIATFNRVRDPLATSRAALWREHSSEGAYQTETVFTELPLSMLLRHRDIGLPLWVQAGSQAEDDRLGIGLPAHLLEGFLSRTELSFPGRSDP